VSLRAIVGNRAQNTERAKFRILCGVSRLAVPRGTTAPGNLEELGSGADFSVAADVTARL
jgi:hypothetical protein